MFGILSDFATLNLLPRQLKKKKKDNKDIIKYSRTHATQTSSSATQESLGKGFLGFPFPPLIRFGVFPPLLVWFCGFVLLVLLLLVDRFLFLFFFVVLISYL